MEEQSDLEDLIFIKSLLKIIIDNSIDIELPEYKEYVSLDRSILETNKFISHISNDYSTIFNNLLNSNIIEYDYSIDSNSKLIYYGGRKKINLFVTHSIADSYSLTHEFFHYLNTDTNNLTSNWNLTTELLSITAELFQKMYMEKNSNEYKEYSYNEISNYLGIKEKAYILDFEVNLLEIYMKYHKLDKNTIYYILDDKDDDYISLAFHDIDSISKSMYLNYSDLQRYIIAGVLSSHLLSIYNKNNNYDLFKYLNDNCNKLSFVEVLEKIGLSLDDKEYVILSNKSLDVLNKEFSERVYRLKYDK